MITIPDSLLPVAQTLLSPKVEESLIFLLEQKHLYQSYQISSPDSSEAVKEIKPSLEPISDIQVVTICEKIYSDIAGCKWNIKDPPDPVSRRRLPGGYIVAQGARNENLMTEFAIYITPQTINTFCPICKEIEPYNFLGGNDIIDRFEEHNLIQIFQFNYQCQRCKFTPEVFLVRREGSKITLNGRSPMEVVQVPTFIPKKQRGFFSDAIIATNSGQILAGVFLLRTFIEQYVRQVTNNPDAQKIDDQFWEKYNSTLLIYFREQYPSLKSVYEDLSIAIHKAVAEEELFKKAREDIKIHFDARRLNKIP